ncbi:GntR family transcriptional regulator [Methyloraptor flagellatus]|jgi:DNA-binding GntR family transcriptional regulator|uniref:GntR family transcriptional regulator n=1 Tax=Methyloraptor flagellatus TaxID=3162530 RepID=A0AAU7XDH8_9HYPH
MTDTTDTSLPNGDGGNGDGGTRGQPVDRAQLIHAGVVTAILEHRLLPGTKLGEDDLGQIYGVSRTIVRAALQSLAHEGIVVIEKNRGAFVAHPSVQDAREVFEARKLIEPEIARLAAHRRAAFGDDLAAHLAEERAALERGDDRAAIRLSGEFHLLVARKAGHRLYESLLRELVARSSLVILLYRSRRARVCGTDHHEVIAAAIEAGDAERAAHLMVHHLDEIEDGLDLVEEEKAVSPLSDILGA